MRAVQRLDTVRKWVSNLMRIVLVLLAAASGSGAIAAAQSAADGEAGETLFIREFRVQGVNALPAAQVQASIYRFLGPGRQVADIERARQALEQFYHESGYQTVQVEVPPQQVRRGVVVLRVNEIEVGRLRVRDARYTEPERIRAAAPSLTEGRVPNFNDVMRDVMALNQQAHRRVIPDVRPGVAADTIDVDLLVEDQLPLSGSVEVNNRYSSGTERTRINAAARYEDLWQAGHTLGVSLQVGPENWDEVFVLSAFYSMRLGAQSPWRLMLQGNIQDTNISSLGGITVAGKGETIGWRLIYTPDQLTQVFQSISFGFDYRRNRQDITFSEDNVARTPIRYLPVSVLYSLVLPCERVLTEFYAGLTFHLRGLGSQAIEWQDNRYRADANFVTLRGEFAQTWQLPKDFSFYGRLQGQLASGPLLSNQQFALGGLDTVRGYLEGEGIGDQGVAATLELRGPAIWQGGDDRSRLSLHGFVDAGRVYLRSPLPGQAGSSGLSSMGAGVRFQLRKAISGSLDLAWPLADAQETEAGETRVIFVIRGEL